MLSHDGPVILDCVVEKHENCFPMIPSGSAHNEMIMGHSHKKESIGAKGAVLV
jgi:acetolactate synthase-1/2/3 large subunit